MGPGNSLDVSVAFPSLTFPSRFRYVSVRVSVAFPLLFRRVSVAFPLGKCPPDGNYRAGQRLGVFWTRAAEQIPRQARSGAVVSTSSRNLQFRVRSQGSTFSERVRRYAVDSSEPARQMRRRPKGRTDPNVFRQVSVNVSVACSSTFPLCFRQRFRRVFVDVSVMFPSTFPLRFR